MQLVENLFEIYNTNSYVNVRKIFEVFLDFYVIKHNEMIAKS